MTAILFRMPAGIPGSANRAQSLSIITEVITPFGTTGAPTAYGIPVVLDATTHNVRSLTAGDTTCYGILIRPYPTQDFNVQAPVGTSTPPTQGACDVLLRGYVSVLLSGSAAATKGGPVYIWTAAASGAHITGGFEATTPGGSGFQLTNAFWVGPADANGISELAFNI